MMISFKDLTFLEKIKTLDKMNDTFIVRKYFQPVSDSAVATKGHHWVLLWPMVHVTSGTIAVIVVIGVFVRVAWRKWLLLPWGSLAECNRNDKDEHLWLSISRFQYMIME